MPCHLRSRRASQQEPFWCGQVLETFRLLENFDELGAALVVSHRDDRLARAQLGRQERGPDRRQRGSLERPVGYLARKGVGRRSERLEEREQLYRRAGETGQWRGKGSVYALGQRGV